MNTESQIVVDNLLVHYRQTGSGKTILFLHGWGDAGSTFNELANKLSSEYSVWLVDLPGFGKTQAPLKTWSVPDYSQFLSSFVTKVRCNPAVVMGHSNGGTIAINSVASGLLKPQKLVLLASAGVRSEYRGRKKFLRLLAKGAKIATKPLPKGTQERLKKKAYKSIGSDLFVAEHLQETFKQVVSYDVVNESAKINIPTLMIYGSADEATPPRYGELFKAHMKNARLEIVPGVGHFVHKDALEETYKLIEDFLHV